MKKFSIKLSEILFWGIYFPFLGFFLWNLSSYTYLDYAEGEYLYQTWQWLAGKKLYREIFAPQPSFNYFFTALLMQVYDSPIFFRAFSVSTVIFSVFIAYLLVKKVFKSKILARLVLICPFFMPVLSSRMNVYTPEIWQLLFFSIILFFLVNKKVGDIKTLLSIIILVNLAVFTKYTSLVVLGSIFFVFAFIYKDFRLASKFLLLTVLSLILLFLFFFKLYGMDFVNQTVVIRKHVPFKSALEIIQFVVVIFLVYGPFWILNLLLAIKSKDFRRKILALWPILNLPIIYTAFVTTTFYYVYLPYEILTILGFLYYTLNFKRTGRLVKALLFWGVLSFVYIIQTFPAKFNANSKNSIYEKTTLFAKNVIEENTQLGEEIYAPQYLAYITKRPLVADFNDIYLFSVDYKLNKAQFSGEKIKLVVKKIKKAELPVILADWRVRLIPEIYNSLVNSKEYIKIGKKGAFFLGPFEWVEIFIRKK